MLSAINTKILLAILAALTVIGGAAIYQRDARSRRKLPPFSSNNRGMRKNRRDGTKPSGSR